MSLSAGTILQSRYRILRKLGQGGMGAVYEAFDLHVSAVVALKETSNSENISLNAFRKEARLLANLHHESLPLVMDCFYENGGWFFVMEYVEGDDIEKSLEVRKNPFPVGDVLTWADQILDALEYLHENGIIHLDIKPSNLKLTNRRKIKLLDFGISKGAIGEITTLQNSYAVYGATRRYAPLEQLLLVYPDSRHILEINFADRIESFCKTIDQRTDLFALATTLYQLLSRRCPETADLRAMSIWSGKGDNLKPLSDVLPEIPRELEAVLHRALALEKKDRFASAAEMRRHLARARAKIENREPAAAQNPIPQIQTAENSVAHHSETLINHDDHRKILEKQSELRAEQRELLERNEKNRRRTLTLISITTVFIFGLIVGIIATVPGSTAHLENRPANVNQTPAANLTQTPQKAVKPKKKKRRK
jgi:serine/threonine protein kinase